MLTISEGLARENVETLKHFSKLLGGGKKVTRKAELINLIASHLQGQPLRDLWDRMDPLQQTAIAETIYSSSLSFDAAHFQAKYGAVPALGENIHNCYSPGPPLARVLLHPHGISAKLAARLKEFVPEPGPAAIVSVKSQPDDANDEPTELGQDELDCAATVVMEQAAQRDLKLILLLAREGKLRVSETSGWPNAAGTAAVEAVLTGGDFYSPTLNNDLIDEAADDVGPIKSFAWPLLLLAAGLVVKDGTRLKLTKAGDIAIAAAAPKTISLIWKRWLAYTGFDEFRRIDEIKGQQERGRASFSSVVTRRRVISAALRGCRVGDWIDVDEFFRFMQASKHYFEVTRDPWDLYISHSDYGSLGHHGFHEWEILQGRYILCFLFEYAATLGMVDVAYDSPVDARDDFGDLWGTDCLEFLSRYDGLREFRLTPLGAYCLGIAAEYTPTPVTSSTPITTTTSFTLLPSLRVIVQGELSIDELAMLESIAERVSETEWSLSTIRTVRAIETGHDSNAFVEFLQSRDEQPLPDTVSKFFSGAVNRAVAVKDRGEARLIECADATLAETIANAPATKPYCLRAGDLHLVVSSKHEQSFRKGLEKLGYILSV